MTLERSIVKHDGSLSDNIKRCQLLTWSFVPSKLETLKGSTSYSKTLHSQEQRDMEGYLWRQHTFVLDGDHLPQLQGGSPHPAQRIRQPLGIPLCQVPVLALLLLAPKVRRDLQQPPSAAQNTAYSRPPRNVVEVEERSKDLYAFCTHLMPQQPADGHTPVSSAAPAVSDRCLESGTRFPGG